MRAQARAHAYKENYNFIKIYFFIYFSFSGERGEVNRKEYIRKEQARGERDFWRRGDG
jgi:hypothetical protein